MKGKVAVVTGGARGIGRAVALRFLRDGAHVAVLDIRDEAADRIDAAARVGSSGEAVYSAAKGGVIAFTKAVAREVARHGIRVNCVCPGPTDTPLLAETLGSEEGTCVIEAIKRGIPFRRLGTPEEIAAAVRFLASDDASYVTGQVLSVNGGLNMTG